MAEGTYEYECMRAELLGLDAPDRDEFDRKKAELEEIKEIMTKNIEEVVEVGTEFSSLESKTDELNNILASTHKKIDRFKSRCGSVTELIKTKISGIAGELRATTTQKSEEQLSIEPQEPQQQVEKDEESRALKSDLTRALDKQTNALDSLLDKSEHASISMTEQNKTMKKLLR